MHTTEEDYLKNLSDLVATIQDASQNLNRTHKALNEKALSKTTSAERTQLHLKTFQKSIGWGTGKNAKAAEAILKTEEMKLGLFERSLSLDEMAVPYNPEWISNKHLEIVQTLELDKLSKVLERAIEMQVKPERPHHRANNHKTPSAQPR